MIWGSKKGRPQQERAVFFLPQPQLTFRRPAHRVCLKRVPSPFPVFLADSSTISPTMSRKHPSPKPLWVGFNNTNVNPTLPKKTCFKTKRLSARPFRVVFNITQVKALSGPVQANKNKQTKNNNNNNNNKKTNNIKRRRKKREGETPKPVSYGQLFALLAAVLQLPREHCQALLPGASKNADRMEGGPKRNLAERVFKNFRTPKVGGCPCIPPLPPNKR